MNDAFCSRPTKDNVEEIPKLEAKRGGRVRNARKKLWEKQQKDHQKKLEKQKLRKEEALLNYKIRGKPRNLDAPPPNVN